MMIQDHAGTRPCGFTAMQIQGHVATRPSVLIRNLLQRNKSVINFIYQIDRVKCQTNFYFYCAIIAQSV